MSPTAPNPVLRSPWRTMALAMTLALFAGWLRAADTPEPTAPREPVQADTMAQARQALAAKDWARATTLLRQAVARTPGDADAHNLLGFSLRWQGKLDEALASYGRALALAPQHRGAHEYVGIAWLLAGKPDKAREHLATLERLCPEGCDERKSLAERLAQAGAVAQR